MVLVIGSDILLKLYYILCAHLTIIQQTVHYYAPVTRNEN
jgi:hypothetical protein